MIKFNSVLRTVACILISLWSVLGFSCKSSPEKLSQKNKSAPEFSFLTVGSGSDERFGEWAHKKLFQLQKNKHEVNCLLQAIAIETQTKPEVLEKYRISSSWFDQTVDALISLNFLGKTEDSEFYKKVPVMVDAEMKRVQESLNPLVRRVAEIISEHIPDIKQTYNEMKQKSDLNWEYISQLVIDKYLIDGFFHHGLVVHEREKGVKKYYSLDQKKVPAFFLERGSMHGTFGVNWYGFKGQNTERNIYVLHGAPFRRFNVPFNQYGWDKDFSEVFLRIRTDGGLENLTQDEIQIFRDLGWVVNHKLAIPFVQTNSLKIFRNDLKIIGNQAAEIVFEYFSIVIESYKDSPNAKYSEGAGDFIQVCYHLMFSSIINELIDMKALPPIPDPAPDHFGVYITQGGNFFDDLCLGQAVAQDLGLGNCRVYNLSNAEIIEVNL